MKLSVRYFAMFTEVTGTSNEILEFEGTNIMQLKKVINDLHPELSRKGMMVAVNERYSDDSTILAEGDTVAIFPPVSGG